MFDHDKFNLNIIVTTVASSILLNWR